MECGVCHDRATGVHYGLATCEGCKGRNIRGKQTDSFKVIFLRRIFQTNRSKQEEISLYGEWFLYR